ncbi:MAG: hypothetical protein ACI8ZB_001795 [Desulforhopalus sp.]|jgi:hypothetical protein
MKQYHLRNNTKSLFCTKCIIGLFVVGVMFVNGRDSMAATVYYSTTHVFSIDDVQGGFDGSTYGPNGVIQVPEIICGIESDCPGDAMQPIDDSSGITLYPVDSEFGFYVEDFVGAAQKTRDGDYAEGWVGNIESSDGIIGIRVSNAATDSFKVPYPLGNWCAGLGGNKVKCCSEHYVVMEHVKTCNETNPYYFYDFDKGQQRELIDPDTGQPMADDEGVPLGLTCEEGKLDNTLYQIKKGVLGADLLLPDSDGNPVMIANESYVLNDIAASKDYSITKKDDGKALYRFGSMIKRPNDIRLYARMPLPQEWKDDPGLAFSVSRAELHVDHLITNNPNDQIRPEDMENEGATGRLPQVITGEGDYAGVWFSAKDCYEGDGDFIAAGTLYKDSGYEIPVGSVLMGDAVVPYPTELASDFLVPYSEDLQEGFTNAWYTTTDRDPFEPDLVSGIGPRWRLKANKFGQDLPGLEIPSVECMATPYTSKFKKYEVGVSTTTIINLLDAEGTLPAERPLDTSLGWMGGISNGINELAIEGLSINGLPLTDDFDLAVYVKGDRKSTAVYNATLIIEYEGSGTYPDTPSSEGSFDLDLVSFKVPKKIFSGMTKNLRTEISNLGPDVARGVIEFTGEGVGDVISESYEVAPGDSVRIVTPWEAPWVIGGDISVLLTATIIADGDENLENNSEDGTVLVRATKE